MEGGGAEKGESMKVTEEEDRGRGKVGMREG